MAIPIIPEFIYKMDWALLRKQKETLHSLAVDRSIPLTDTDREHLEGLINTIDAIQDYACDDLQMSTKVIFDQEIEED